MVLLKYTAFTPWMLLPAALYILYTPPTESHTKVTLYVHTADKDYKQFTLVRILL